ncbi:hypothetical protein OPIT5_10880 [Opitutaceae bacterium TAV5]|nr:hypothetical protein OPIT5_10880 [Opitutaceae bacterium TAV5]
MATLDYQRTVFAYHGCDRHAAKRILDGDTFRSSDNDYDWLGRGIYFWEYGPERALQWARETGWKRRPKPSRRFQPAVVGAVIHLGRCLDLLDVRYTTALRDIYPEFVQLHRDTGVDLPKNSGIMDSSGLPFLRRLD